MTRKDYYIVAEALAKCKSIGEGNLLYVADMVATDMERDNPAFKRELFLKTVGVEDVPVEE